VFPRSLHTIQGGSLAVNPINHQNNITPTVNSNTVTVVNPNQEIVADYIQKAGQVEVLKKRDIRYVGVGVKKRNQLYPTGSSH
jgi:hypothetical protein